MGQTIVDHHRNILLTILLIGISSLIWVMWGREIGVGTDAVHYLATARNIYEGRGWLDYNDAPLAVWPPLYPLTVALGMWMGMDVITSAKVINLIAYVLAVIWGNALIQEVVSQRFRLLAIVLYALGQPIMIMFTQAMSEPLFIAWTNGTFYYLHRWIQHPNWKTGTTLSIILTLLMMQRYIGMTLWITGTLWIWTANRFRQRQGWVVKWGMVWMPSMILLGIWMWYSYLSSGQWGGRRGVPFYSMIEWLGAMMRTFIDWTVPWVEQFGTIWNVCSAIAFSSLVIAATAVCLRCRRIPPPLWRWMLIWSGIYLAFLAWNSSRMWISLPGQRLLSPLFIVFTIALFRAAQCFLHQFPHHARNIIGVLGIMVAMHIGQSMYAMYSAYRHGQHYDALHHHLLEQWLQAHPSIQRVVTNHPERFFLWELRNGRRIGWFIPEKVIADGVDSLFVLWDRPPEWVRPPSARLYLLIYDSLLRTHFRIDTVSELGTEAVIRLQRRAPSTN